MIVNVSRDLRAGRSISAWANYGVAFFGILLVVLNFLFLHLSFLIYASLVLLTSSCWRGRLEPRSRRPRVPAADGGTAQGRP